MSRRRAVTEKDALALVRRDALERLTGSQEEKEEHATPDRKAEPEGSVRITVYLSPEQLIALEEMRLKRLKETGRPVNKSQLIREAVDLLIGR